MYSHNPYLEAARKRQVPPKQPPREAPQSAPRDGVLSRVAKRPTVSKPQVKLSLAPRYRFALPDPPADLKMLFGPLMATSAPAQRTHKLELNAKVNLIPLHPCHGLHMDLVQPMQQDAKRAGEHVSVEDRAALLSVDMGAAQQQGTGHGRDAASNGLTGPDRGALSGSRLQGGPNAQLKQAPAFPWMRRMSYDEYFSGTNRNAQSKADSRVESEGSRKLRTKKLEEERLRQAIESFDKVRRPNIKHPDKLRANLTVKSVQPVFPHPPISGDSWVSLQFDKMAAMETMKNGVAFKNCASVIGEDDEKKRYMSCYVPNDRTIDAIEKGNDVAIRVEDHERVREYSVRDAASGRQTAAVEDELEADAVRRSKRSFIMTSHGEGKESMVSISSIPSSFVLVSRPAVLPGLGKEYLELTREEEQRASKRQRVEEVVSTLLRPQKRKA